MKAKPWAQFFSVLLLASSNSYAGTYSDDFRFYRNESTVDFRVSTTNNYVRTPTTTFDVELTAGVPSEKAVLIDSTAYSNAIWTSYTSSNITLDLGATEGWHEVWTGLRSSRDDPGTWQWKRIKLDRTPPTIVITSPTNKIVSEQMIQLLGYSPEALSTISCDASNAAGVFNDQMILVLDHEYDTQNREFTTSTFQGFDLDLTNGLNSFTIRATDRAGNLTTTNFNFTLASDSVAPVVQLWWPQDGAELCDDLFTWRGLVDDFTAKLTAEIAGPDGTNERTALVERDGKFWFEDLPLQNGTNFLTLTAIDHWGNTTWTNITVRRSLVNITIDPVDENLLNNPTITVTGTINVNDHTVWVNGVKASFVFSDSTNVMVLKWKAERVPVTPGNTAVIQARAIPNSDNGGNGTPANNTGSPQEKNL